MSDAESSTQTVTCPLLKLPPEIRSCTWTLVVKVGIVYIKSDCPKPSDKHLSPNTMAVAFTCRQIHREVTPIYYSKNLFYFPENSPFDFPQRFAAAIGPANAESITEVQILHNFHVMPVLRGPSDMRLLFPNLKALWGFHAVYSHCDDKPTTRLCHINLLETQTGRSMMEPYGPEPRSQNQS